MSEHCTCVYDENTMTKICFFMTSVILLSRMRQILCVCPMTSVKQTETGLQEAAL